MIKFLLPFLIILLAAILRFNQLNHLPALNADEAAIGYNAYSLLKTGKDEHGNPWPVHFQSFYDYKPGLFFYIVLPFIKVLGLTELAVRIPGALLGIGTVVLLWFLVRAMFPDKKRLADLATLFLAVSPWHIHFSRGGWEVNAATFFITLGVLGFVNGVKKRVWLWVGILAFVASLYTYHAARVVVPLLGLVLIIIFRTEIIRYRKYFIAVVVVGLLLLLPLAKGLTSPVLSARASGVGIFADSGIVSRINEQRGEHGNIRDLPAFIIHNKFVNYSLAFLSNWLKHYDGEFLFLSGDEIQRNRIPETGLLYLYELPFVLLGLVMIARNSKGWGIVISWLLLSPVASALTFQSPHALRAHNMVIPITIISAFGLLRLLGWLRNIKSRFILATCYLLLVIFITWNISRYLHHYYIHMAKAYPFSSQYGVKELVSYIKANYNNYPVFWITDRYDQPYILFLFYLKYPPEKFQNSHELTGRDKYGFSTVRNFDKFRFASIGDWQRTADELEQGFIAGTDAEIPDEANIIHEINFPNGKKVFQIVVN